MTIDTSTAATSSGTCAMAQVPTLSDFVWLLLASKVDEDDGGGFPNVEIIAPVPSNVPQALRVLCAHFYLHAT